MSEIKGALSQKEFKEQVEPTQEVLHLRSKVSSLESKIKEIREGEGELRSLIHTMTQAIEPLPAPRSVYKKSDENIVDSPIEAILQCNDWHYGAVQKADEIESFGEFNPEIARKRVMKKLVPAFLNWVNIHRKSYTCNTLRIFGLGDFISGDIHDELMVTNEFPSPVQAVKVSYLFSDMIAELSKYFQEVIVDFVTSDNHGRMTRKPQSKEEGLNNYMYIVGSLAKERLVNIRKIKFNIYPRLQQVVEVSGLKYLLTHGHTIKGWAGHPYYGIDRRIGKEAHRRMQSIKELRELVRFSKLVMAHFHAPANMMEWMIGGSLSGTDAYDHKFGRYCPPIQTAWFVHPKHGEFDWTKFRLDENG